MRLFALENNRSILIYGFKNMSNLIQNQDITYHSLKIKKGRKTKTICCNLYQEEISMLTKVKEHGLDERIIVNSSKAVRIGILLINQMPIEQIIQLTQECNKSNTNLHIVHKPLEKKTQIKSKYQTFSLNYHSVQIIHQTIEKALDIRKILSISGIIRLAIKEASKLNSQLLKEYFIKI